MQTALSETPAIKKRDMVENVQALRGITALLVIWAHIIFPVADLCPAGRQLSFVAAGNGAIGVDIFFAISGFVISLAACKRHYHPLEFFMARYARVSPLNFCFVLIFLFAKGIGTHRLNTFSSIWNGFLYLPVFDMRTMSWPPGGLGWSLCFEMWFYVVFAVMLVFWPPQRAGLFLPLVFIVGAPLATLYRGDWYFPHFMFHPFTLNFAAGCVIFQIQRFLTARVSWVLLVAALAYLLAFTRGSGYMAYPTLMNDGIALAWTRVFLWGIPSALLLAAMVGLERSRAWVCPGWLVWFGTISYSLYLSQGVTMPTFSFVGRHIGLHNLVAILILVPVSCVIVAWLCWMCIEKPLTQCVQNLVRRMWHPRAV